MYTIVIEATLLNRTLCRVAERFHKESVRSLTVSASAGKLIVVVAISVEAKSETATCDRSSLCGVGLGGMVIRKKNRWKEIYAIILCILQMSTDLIADWWINRSKDLVRNFLDAIFIIIASTEGCFRKTTLRLYSKYF